MESWKETALFPIISFRRRESGGGFVSFFISREVGGILLAER